MVEPLTAAVIISLLFSEAFKEGGKELGKTAIELLKTIKEKIREKLAQEGMEGILKRTESQPTETNKVKLQEEVQEQINKDNIFAEQLKALVEQLKEQEPTVRQVLLSGIETEELKAKDITQEAMGNRSTNQELLTNIKAQNIDVGNLSQKA